MEIRNPEYNGLGGIDVELYHDEFGWMPFTAMPFSNDDEVKAVWEAVKDRDDIKDFEPPEGWQHELIQKLDRHSEQALMRISNHPQPLEIASWDSKKEIVKRAQLGEILSTDDLIAIAPDIAKFGSVEGALQAIAMNAKLYALASTARKMLMNKFKVQIQDAEYYQEDDILESFKAETLALENRFGKLREAAKAGDFTPLETAYQDVLGGAE